jgi:hypothetical protein
MEKLYATRHVATSRVVVRTAVHRRFAAVCGNLKECVIHHALPLVDLKKLNPTAHNRMYIVIPTTW